MTFLDILRCYWKTMHIWCIFFYYERLILI